MDEAVFVKSIDIIWLKLGRIVLKFALENIRCITKGERSLKIK